VKEQQAAALEAATHRPLARLLSLDDVQAEARRRLPKYVERVGRMNWEGTKVDKRNGYKEGRRMPWYADAV